MAINFLLLSDPRSGTMMLTDAIDELPCVKFYNIYASNPDNPRGHHLNWRSFQNSEEMGITHYGTTMHRVGDGWFKQLSHLSPEKFWEEMNERNEFQICLHRENLLRCFLSHKVGVLLRSYQVQQERKVDPGPARLPIQELMEFVGNTQLLQEKIDSFFPGRMNVSYEELDTAWDVTIKKIQNYLRLPFTNIQPVTIKQEKRPLKEAIENYDEIHSYLTNRGLDSWLN